jgi:hypothetical protein
MTTTKVRLTNGFHGSSVNVVGELVDLGSADLEYDGAPGKGFASVRLSDAQVRRAARSLCGIKECCCGHHGPRFEPGGNPANGTTWTVVGEVV